MQLTEVFICHLDNSRIFSMRNWFIEFTETEGKELLLLYLMLQGFGM